MTDINELIRRVAQARQSFIAAASGLSNAQANYKPAPDAWSINENVEHMVWAEQGGINGMWKALYGVKAGQPIFTGEDVHRGLSIEEIIGRTWQEKEQVPEIAKPRWGGPIAYWISALQACQGMLEALGRELKGMDLEQIIYPHIISGPLNARQRLEFLRFHLERHLRQIENIKQAPRFPAGGPLQTTTGIVKDKKVPLDFH